MYSYNDRKRLIISSDITQQIYDDVIFACKTFLQNNTYANNCREENQRNDFIRDMLRKDYAPADQTRQGASFSGKSAGEVDIVLRKNNSMVAVIEALNLDGVDKKYISNHIDKVFNYDTIGNKTNLIIAYVDIKNFDGFWEDYVDYVISYNYRYPIINIDTDSHEQYSELRIISVVLNRNDVPTQLYHIAIHIQLPNIGDERII